MAGRSSSKNTPAVNVVLISLDSHLSNAVDQARMLLRKEIPNLNLTVHAASDWDRSPESLEDCIKDIGKADFIVASMLFMENHIKAVLPALIARRDQCDAIAGCLSAPEVVKLTSLGRFQMDKPETGMIAILKRLRGSKEKTSAGAHQMKMLRRLPKILKYIPGTAQDVRAYFLTLQYWLAGSETNIANAVKFLIDRYADGPRKELRGALSPKAPIEYPDVGVYHPKLKSGVVTNAAALPLAKSKKPTVGLLIMRSYVLSGDTNHYDGVIASLEARGLRVIPAFASGLDARPAIEKYFVKNGEPIIDALVSLTGFSLVGGPAYNDAGAAAETLTQLDVPYLSAQALEFQNLNEWGNNAQGLSPVEATMMVAIPEIDGATNPVVFGGRATSGTICNGCDRNCEFTAANDHVNKMQSCSERADMISRRVEKLIRLRRKEAQDRKIAITIFNFPPNGGSVGTAASLDVYASLFNTLKGLAADGYKVDLPKSVDDLRDRILGGNSIQKGTEANVHDHVALNDYVRHERRLSDIEKQWGPAPGRHQSDGRSIQIFGAQFGNVLVGVQPAFGYEGDPMRLLFEQGFAPTHAFAAYYSYLKNDFDADAVLHFGTHGALEFMPGKQTGLSGDCWSDYLIGDLPNFYFYAGNNPSEATIAKRRSAATTISYLTPAVTNAGLYKDLAEMKSLIERWRITSPDDARERQSLAETIQAHAAQLDMAEGKPVWTETDMDEIEKLRLKLLEVEDALIPHGLHIAGEAPSTQERIDVLSALVPNDANEVLPIETITAIVEGKPLKKTNAAKRVAELTAINDLLLKSNEIPSIMTALAGKFIAPVAGGDLIHDPAVLPTGRNIHGFDPFKLPSLYAVADGKRQSDRLLQRHLEESAEFPETIALVLWGTDNLKSEGAQLAQALALMGATPRFDSYGRLCGADLIPLEELGRPRVDVVVTLSGIFRDLLPMQTKMLAQAALAAAQADEPLEQNFIRKHTLAYQQQHDCDFEIAALRVFSNADGAYGSNVNQMIEAGCWDDEDELADAYSKRKCFAYGASGKPSQQADMLDSILHDVDLAYQNLESVELGLTTIDHYFDTLGGIGRAVKRAKGTDAPVYIGDQTRGDGTVRTLSEQVSLETRTRTLNPKWYEGMLKHGYEGVRQIEAHVTNTMGWSATTGQVDPWVYERITETFVLDTDLLDRMAQLNPKSCAKVTNRLLEACDRNYWTPDDDTLEALRRAGEDLEDRIEGIGAPAGAAA